MRARRQPGPEQMTAGIRQDGSLGMEPSGWIPWDGSAALCSSAPFSSPSPQGLGHCHKDPGEGRGKESSIGKHRFVYLYVVKLK